MDRRKTKKTRRRLLRSTSLVATFGFSAALGASAMAHDSFVNARPTADAAASRMAPADAAGSESRAALADFGGTAPSRSAREVADWALASHDPQGLPFLIVDKRAATLYVFDARGRLAGSSPVLLGLAHGDDSVPGIGDRPMERIRPHERTTPAGRFLAERGVNLHGEDILWIDYDAAVSMHRVRTSNPKERRLERLRTPTIDDNRISYGCINVPARFYERFVVPAFSEGHAVVYVLPETRSAREQFRFDVPARSAVRAEAGV